MTGEQVSGGAEQPQVPARCLLANACGYVALDHARHYPFGPICDAEGCTLLGGNLNITNGVGAAMVRVMRTPGRTAAPGCPEEAFLRYDATPPPLSIARPWTERREQQIPPGATTPDQLPPPPSA